MAEQCPICLSSAERGADRDYGDKKRFRCPRCGAYEISGTALAMLAGRVAHDNLARVRLSHNIRSSTSDTNPLFVSSTNIDELANRPLPGIAQQIELLIHWLAGQLGENRFGRIKIPAPDYLAGIFGTADGEGVNRLIAYAAKKGIIDHSLREKRLGLTPEGWEMLEPPPKNEEKPKEARGVVALAPEIIRAHCNHCGGERNAYKRASHRVVGEDGEVSWANTYDVLECCGCNELSVRHELWLSEWDEFDEDPLTGEPRLTPGIKVTYWPPPTQRERPNWIDALPDESLRKVMDEVYQALNAGLIVLASIGTRTLLDRAMFLRVGDPKGGFAGKLDQMAQNGHIGQDEKGILQVITDAGSAAAHRGFAPNPQMLETIVDTVENFLHREFVLKTAAGQIKTATPPKPKQSKKP